MSEKGANVSALRDARMAVPLRKRSSGRLTAIKGRGDKSLMWHGRVIPRAGACSLVRACIGECAVLEAVAKDCLPIYPRK